MTTHETLASVGEFELLRRLPVAAAGHVAIGRGDDAAFITTSGSGYLISTDVLVEGHHFRRDWSSAYDVGRKAAAVNMSDINAMGGTANALTVGFCAPGELELTWAVDLYRGLVDEAAQVGAIVVGGDVSASGEIVISVTATGEVYRPVTRAGALPGDVVAYAGRLGWAGAGFATLSRGFGSPRAAVEAHRAPRPPYGAGPQAADLGATAMIDVSDGLVGDLGHIARSSGVGIDLDSESFDLSGPIETVARALGADPVGLVLSGGDDYALVATFSSQTELPEEWAAIGRVIEGDSVLVDGKPYEGPSTHEHFR